MTVFVDTSVIMYAAGAEHPHRAACRRVLEQVGDGSLDAVTSTEVVQEILRRFGRGRRDIGQRMARGVLDLFDDLIPIDRPAILATVSLFAEHPQLSARDALHVATCVNRAIGEIVSVDGGFDAVAGVRRVDPAEFADGP
ncbi:MAG: type II toxin-antitoxin system VapC family toxin [Solirubrobacteraceae bacterium]